MEEVPVLTRRRIVAASIERMRYIRLLVLIAVGSFLLGAGAIVATGINSR